MLLKDNLNGMSNKKMSIFDTFLFAINRGSKAAKAADFYSGDFYQRGIKNLV